MVTCYVGIGSNMGDRIGYIKKAISEIRSTEGINLLRSSSIYETDPMGGPEQGKFLNGVIEMATSLAPRDLLKELNRIEASLGRLRTVRNGPRTIDLDILYYGDEEIDLPGLVIPHPRMGSREFVLKGLRELGKVKDEAGR